jgi:hypothetical protein
VEKTRVSARVKCSTNKHKKRRWFGGKRRQEAAVDNGVNNVVNNPGFGEENVNNVLPVPLPLPTPVINESVNNVNNECISSRKVIPVTPQKVSLIPTGYRIMDIKILSDVIHRLQCPDCGESVSLTENHSLRKGFSSALEISCACIFKLKFQTSRNIKNGFDVNKRIVYTMRTLGQGHAGLERFTTLMDMPKPMTRNNYDKTIIKLAKITKSIAEETMADAAEELKGERGDEVVDISVSVDGSWQRRGYSSNNGVTTAISVDTGKILDIEPMSRLSRHLILV